MSVPLDETARQALHDYRVDIRKALNEFQAALRAHNRYVDHLIDSNVQVGPHYKAVWSNLEQEVYRLTDKL